MAISPRDHAILTAEKFLTRGAYILDTETTGLGDTAEIVEIALLHVDGRLLYNRLVKPSRPIPAEATAIHGLTDTDVANAPTWPEIWPSVRELLRDRTVIAYNAIFDQRMVEQSCAAWPTQIRNGRYAPREIVTTWACLMELWMRFTNAEHRISLANACATAGIAHGAGHRARADAEAARQLLHWIAEQRLEV